MAQLLEEARRAYRRGDEGRIVETTYADGRWIQIVPFVLNLDYPLKSNPKKLLRQLDPPPSVVLDSWKRKQFVTLAYDEADAVAVADFVVRYIHATSA